MFGVHQPNSDYDYKSVVLLPIAERLSPPKGSSVVSGDNSTESEEQFHFEAFIRLLKEGQTIPLEMLFCGPNEIVETSSLWDLLLQNRHKLIHRNISKFFGMARSQAVKYSEKGLRIQAFYAVLDFLKQYPEQSRLRDHTVDLELFLSKLSFPSQVTGKELVFSYVQTKKGMTELYLNVCGVKLGANGKIKALKDIVENRLNVYGERALAAFKNDATDYKALSHCVRVAREAKELFLDHKITLPLKEEDRDLVLKIKLGQMSREDIMATIEEEFRTLEEAQKISDLQEQPDLDFLDDLLNRYKAGYI